MKSQIQSHVSSEGKNSQEIRGFWPNSREESLRVLMDVYGQNGKCCDVMKETDKNG